MKTHISQKKVTFPYSPENPEMKKIEGRSPNKAKLLKAAANGCNANLLGLIHNGVDIHTADHNGPDAPLRYACANRHPTTVMLLLKHGANPNIKRGLALKLAAISGSIKTMEIFISQRVSYPIDNEIPFEYSFSRKTYRMSKTIVDLIKETKE